MLGAVVLAAGISSRMGTSKALLGFRGTTFIGAIMATIRNAAIDYAVVVVSPNDNKILQDNELASAFVVFNHADNASGPIESIRSGIDFLVNHMVDYAIVWPVDQPHITTNTISMLVDRVRSEQPAIAVPKFKAKRGHPVFFAKGIFPELRSALADHGADAVVRRIPSRVLEIQVDDPAVVEDIDTPEAYQRLLSREP